MENGLHFGVIGLEGIGGALAAQALGKGMHVVAYDPAGASEELLRAGIDRLDMPGQFHQRLEPPRKILLQVSAAAVERCLAQLTPVLQPGDLVIDGSDSHWADSARRQRHCLEQHGIRLVDCGIAASGAHKGACFMLGGRRQDVQMLEPILSLLAAPGGFVHCGPPGSGHFAKAVHDAIETAMLQAIGEGVQLLELAPDPLPLGKIIHAWAVSASIRSWPLELLSGSLEEGGGCGQKPTSDTDSGRLLAEAALRRIPVPIIAQAATKVLLSRKAALESERIPGLIRGAMEFPRKPGKDPDASALAGPLPPGHAPQDQAALWLAKEAPRGAREGDEPRPD